MLVVALALALGDNRRQRKILLAHLWGRSVAVFWLFISFAPVGEFDKTNAGVYYKNVRAEFATLVCTPAHAEYQDGLAFTRSLGDFYLHTYGE